MAVDRASTSAGAGSTSRSPRRSPNSRSDRATAEDSLFIPARHVASLGGRYRFDLFGKPATFRAQLASVTDVYGYGNIGEGYYYNSPRSFQMSLTVDM
jgi:iron complex outermembrane receptor protein